VDLFDVETGRPYESGICMLPEDAQMVAWSEEARALLGSLRGDERRALTSATSGAPTPTDPPRKDW